MTKEERERLDREVAAGLGRMYRYLLDCAVNPPECALAKGMTDEELRAAHDAIDSLLFENSQ